MTREVAGETVKAVTALTNLFLLTVDVPEFEDLAAASAAVFGALHDDRIEVVAASQASSRRRMTYVVDAAGHGGCSRVGKRMTEALRAADVDAEVGCQEDVAAGGRRRRRGCCRPAGAVTVAHGPRTGRDPGAVGESAAFQRRADRRRPGQGRCPRGRTRCMTPSSAPRWPAPAAAGPGAPISSPRASASASETSVVT